MAKPHIYISQVISNERICLEEIEDVNLLLFPYIL